MFEGELIIIDLVSGRAVSLLDESREVTGLRWRDGQTLEMTMSVRDDDELEEFGTSAVTTTITLDGWAAVRVRREGHVESLARQVAGKSDVREHISRGSDGGQADPHLSPRAVFSVGVAPVCGAPQSFQTSTGRR